MKVPEKFKVHVLTEQNNNIRNYLKKYWGYTTRMVDEVMKTGQTPRRAEYLEEDSKAIENTNNLRRYLSTTFHYTEEQLDEIQKTSKLLPDKNFKRLTKQVVSLIREAL
jgi:predicted SPOUT superfamily RNA methylase MTH1